MPAAHLDIQSIPEALRQSIVELQRSLSVPRRFTEEIVAEAEAAAAQLPDEHEDMTEIEFVTIDPASSMDLDQAVQIERDDAGYLVRYAISDIGYFLRRCPRLEEETHRRGESLYAPSAKVPLHPTALSEAAASLLADGKPRPAMVWQHRLDSSGELVSTALTRALVRSRAKLSYAQAHREAEEGRPHPSIALLPEVGGLRERLEAERGGISLNLPDQEIVEHGNTWQIEFRKPRPVESYNAHISLLTGFAAAKTMLDGAIGILRTLPPAESWSIQKLRRAAKALGVGWPREVSYPEFVRKLRPDRPAELAVLTKCTLLFRGAGYVAFDGEIPEENLTHGALAAPYAHTTAPLRRLVDRYVLEICHALLNGLPVPTWVREALPRLPEEMAASGRRAAGYERGVMDRAEALVLKDRVGQQLSGVLTDVHPKSGQGTIQIAEPAVELRLTAEPDRVGSEVVVRIDEVDLPRGKVVCSLV